MHIAPINNTNFQGRFKKNQVLERLLTVSDKETLGRFNEVLDRAAKVNDSYIYKFSFIKTNNPISYNKLYAFTLNREDSLQKFTSTEKIVERYIGYWDSESEIRTKCSDVLRQFLPKLEKEYPKTDFQEANSELIQQINNKLI